MLNAINERVFLKYSQLGKLTLFVNQVGVTTVVVDATGEIDVIQVP
jgi:hypothetical protein